VPVHDAGTLADGRAFYVMKLVRGERLDRKLHAEASVGERLGIFLRICDAVSFAHAQGIVHRDLKPENVMIGSFGEVLVMDWGVAKLLAGSDADNVVVGTPGYMAPEQVSGRADARADVFALGVILQGIVPTPAPRPLRAIAEKARSQAIDDRYATVAALAGDVARFRDGRRVEGYRETVPERLGRVYRRHRLPILLVLAYMAMRVALLVWRGI
ncbi:MAG: serine/threonine-protein kinase, partial [Vicinamibacterales bacterium]